MSQVSRTISASFNSANAATVGNLLTENQASTETDTTGWTTYYSGTVSRSTGQAYRGSASILLTAGSGSSAACSQCATSVTPGEVYTSFARVYSPVPRVTYTTIWWYTIGGTFIGASSGSAQYAPVANTWTAYQGSGIAPAGAARAVLLVVTLSNTLGDLHYIDTCGIWAGAGGDWQMPGVPITNLGQRYNATLSAVEHWNGTTWIPQAPLESPTFTGPVTVPTPAAGDSSTKAATTAWAVGKALFNANTILAATTDDTPAALTVGASTVVGRTASGSIAALTAAEMFALAPATDPAPLGSELGTGSGLTQTVTTTVGQTYQVGGASVTAITLDGNALVVSSNYSSFVATATSHVLVGTGGSVLSVKQITGTSTATVTLAGMTVRRYSGLSSLGIGTDSQRGLTTGSSNNALGYAAQYALTTGSSNNALGYAAQRYLTTGAYNNAMGHAAQYSLTAGLSNNAMGYSAQYSLTTGSSNSAMGYHPQYSLTTGSYNNAMGRSAQYSLTTGSSNSAMGHAAQYSLTTGNYNLHLGYGVGNAGGQSATVNGSVAIGTNSSGTGAYTDTDNTIVLGTTAHTVILRNEQELVTAGKGIVLKSPDGTRYRVTVANGGILTVATA
jgi:hypothetical protein